MRIAIVHPSLYTKGGAENVVVWMAEELAKRGHEVDVYTTDYDEAFYGGKGEKVFRIIEMDLGGYKMSLSNLFTSAWKLRNVLQDYDLVIPHNFPSYIYVYFAKRLNPRITKIVWFCEEPYRLFYRGIIDEHVLMLKKKKGRSVFENVNATLQNDGISGSLKKLVVKVKRQVFATSRDKIIKLIDLYVVPRLDLVISNSEFVASNLKKVFGVEAKPALLGIPLKRKIQEKDLEFQNFTLTVSRLFPSKNNATIVSAIEYLVKQGKFKGYKHVFVGTGPLIGELKQQVAEKNLDKYIEFRGFVSNEDVDKLYKKTSLVIYLPLDETYGLVFPEAGLYHKPVLGPNHGGPAEIIKDSVTGKTVNPLEPKDVADSIEVLLSDKGKLRSLGENNYSFTINNLGFHHFIDRFLEKLR